MKMKYIFMLAAAAVLSLSAAAQDEKFEKQVVKTDVTGDITLEESTAAISVITAEDIEHRCGHCYEVRLEQTAKFAAENGFDSFTTTLLVSPYQNHELLAETAERMAQRYGVRFLYRDFRPGFRDGQAKARELGLYMQKYCGCVFSEEDRYQNKIQKDLREPLKLIK